MKYRPELDGLRGLAILAVLLFHCRVPGFGGGYMGVDVFFVLSGYLITTILLAEHAKTGAIALRRFYWRRAVRLYPALLLMLAAYMAIAPFVWPGVPFWRGPLIASTYLSDYAFSLYRIPAYLPHTWSLAVEEHFYLLWPLVLLLLVRDTASMVRRTAMLAAFALVWFLFNRWFFGFDVYYRTDTRLFGLLCGCLLAALYHYKAQAMARLPARACGLAGVALLLAVMPFGVVNWLGTPTLYSPVPELAAACIIIGSARLPLTYAPLVKLGRLSYGVYLWHYSIFLIADRFVRVPIALAATVFALSLFAAWVSWHTVEAVGRRTRLMSSRTGSPSCPQQTPCRQPSAQGS